NLLQYFWRCIKENSLKNLLADHVPRVFLLSARKAAPGYYLNLLQYFWRCIKENSLKNLLADHVPRVFLLSAR
ncbi:hypothetical protein CSW75_26960, partial [Shigella flexneri]